MSNIPTNRVEPVHLPQQRPPRVPPQIAEGDTMERLFQALFYRIAIVYARAIPKYIRRLEETATLVMVFLKTIHLRKNNLIFKILGYLLFWFTYLSSRCIQSKANDMLISFAKFMAKRRCTSC